jgi:hypothetical protein
MHVKVLLQLGNPKVLVNFNGEEKWEGEFWVIIVGGCPQEWAARIERKSLCIYIWGPSELCSLTDMNKLG